MGDYAEQLVKNAAVVWSIAPANYTGAAATGVAISMKHWDHATVIFTTGAWAGGTAAVTLTQDTSVTPTASVKALAFTHYYTNDAATGSNTLVDTTCASTFNLDTANAMYVIEIDADSLDAANNFDTFIVQVASPGANNDYYSACVILTKGRYVGASGTIKDATID